MWEIMKKLEKLEVFFLTSTGKNKFINKYTSCIHEKYLGKMSFSEAASMYA